MVFRGRVELIAESGRPEDEKSWYPGWPPNLGSRYSRWGFATEFFVVLNRPCGFGSLANAFISRHIRSMISKRPVPGLDPGWNPVFGQDHAQTKS